MTQTWDYLDSELILRMTNWKPIAINKIFNIWCTLRQSVIGWTTKYYHSPSWRCVGDYFSDITCLPTDFGSVISWQFCEDTALHRGFCLSIKYNVNKSGVCVKGEILDILTRLKPVMNQYVNGISKSTNWLHVSLSNYMYLCLP